MGAAGCPKIWESRHPPAGERSFIGTCHCEICPHLAIIEETYRRSPWKLRTSKFELLQVHCRRLSPRPEADVETSARAKSSS